MPQPKTSQKGFSLIEGVVVLAVMATVSAIVVPNLTKTSQVRALEEYAKSVAHLSTTMRTYYRQQKLADAPDVWPNGCTDLTQLLSQVHTNAWGGHFTCTGAHADGMEIGQVGGSGIPAHLQTYLKNLLPLTSCTAANGTLTCQTKVMPPDLAQLQGQGQAVLGCTAAAACNYNSSATQDDGSCWNANAGCTCADGESAVEDECGVCNGPGLNFPACDCAGNVDLGCGCDEPAPSGCDNECGSTLAFDACNVCGGDGSSCQLDCNDDAGGSAYVDNCDECVGGATGEVACVQDECGVWGGDGLSNPSAWETAECYGCLDAFNACLSANGLSYGSSQGALWGTCWIMGNQTSNNNCGWLASEGYTNGGSYPPPLSD
ncbi:MAG: prepilin-type N-terminal cleavage/methylation domain-containing protein [Myxococcota bacterium]|nr:prepilin-type N-terminal cleavage/methylation domain-containing protein [Myxococcota bacterium]